MVLLERIWAFSWSDMLVYTALAGSTWLVYFLFIRPFLHPLRKIPGAPYYPLVGNTRELLRGESMQATIDFIRKYGPVTRYYFFFGMERVIIADPQAMKQILVTNCKNYIKPPTRINFMKAILGEGLVTSEGRMHAVHKKLMSPSFNNTSIKKMLPAFEECFEKLANFWLHQIQAGESTAAVDIQTYLSKTTLDVIGKTAFGYEFNSLDDCDHPVSDAFQTILEGNGLSWRMALPFYSKLPFAEVIKTKENLKVMNRAVYDIIKAKRSLLQSGEDVEDTVCSDMLGMMMLALDDNSREGMTDKELRDQVMTIMLAGHETTAVELAWSLLSLAQNPDMQDKAREEIRRVFPTDDTPLTWEKLEQLEYVGCIIKETLRLYPAIPLTLRQAVQSDTIQGYHIPAETILLISLGPMMRLESLFKDAETFNPDRYQDKDALQNMYTFLPFLIGPRMCLGYKFALMEMRAALTILLRRVSFSLIPDTKFKRKARLTMKPNPTLRLNVSRV